MLHFPAAQILWSFLAGFVFLVLLGISRRRRPKDFPPGPLSLPFIGNAHQLGTHPFKTFMGMRKKYGDIFGIDFANFRYISNVQLGNSSSCIVALSYKDYTMHLFNLFSAIVINENALIREAFAIPELCGRPLLRPFLERCGGVMRGIGMSAGQPWIEHRRFTLKTLRDFGFGKSSMETLIQNEIDEVFQVCIKTEGESIQGRHLFALITLNTLWMMIAGERFAYDDQRLKEMSDIFDDGSAGAPAAGAFFFFPTLSRIAPVLILTGYNAFMSTHISSFNLIREKYKEQRASFKSGEVRHLMDVYIQEVVGEKDPNSTFYGELGVEHSIGSISDLFMAGMDTTSTTLSWGFLLLLLNPQVQDKLYNEVKSVLGDATPSLDDKNRLPYMEATITEIVRYSSLLPFGVFHSTTEDVVFHKYKIPKDTMIVANAYAVHHDPEVWGDPDTFRPERFMTADGTISPNRNDYIHAFSCGKRVCIGETMARASLFLFLTRVIQHFKILPNPTKPTPKMEYVPSFVMQTRPYEYILQKRK